MDKEPLGRIRGRLKTRWVNAVDRDLTMARLVRKMAGDRRRWRRTLSDITATRDDGTSQRKRRILIMVTHFKDSHMFRSLHNGLNKSGLLCF